MMAKRMLWMLSVVVVVIASLGFVKYRQIEAATSKFASFQPPPVAVTTIAAKQEQWPATLSAIGSVVAVHGVTVSADLPGIVNRIEFESGKFVRKGEVLVELDTRQERAQLAGAEADRDLAQVNFRRLQGLVQDGVISQAEFDKAEAEQRATAAKVKEIRATIERKTIHAPFSGRLGLRQVNLGQYLSAGNPVVPLESLNPIYVNFGVPQEKAREARVGSKVVVRADELAGRPVRRTRDGGRFALGRGDAQRTGAGDAAQLPWRSCVPACSSRWSLPPVRRALCLRCPLPRSVTRRMAIRCSWLPIFEDRRRAIPIAECASNSSSLEGSRGDQVAVRFGVEQRRRGCHSAVSSCATAPPSR